MERADLVHQFGNALGLHRRGAPARPHAVAAHGNNVTDLSVADPGEQFLAGTAVPDHQPDPDLQVFTPSLFTQRDHAPCGWTIDGDRLFYEDIQPFVDRIAELNPSESGRGCQYCDVAWLQAIHRLAEGIEADELTFLGNVHLGCEAPAQAAMAVAQLLREDVRHSRELDGTVLDSECVLDGARATPATPN